MVSVNEQMNLDLKQAQLGLLNNQNRSTVEPSASHSNSSKITKQVVKPSPNRVTSNTNLTKPPKSSENKSSTLNGIKSKRVPLKVISFEDEDLDMDMTRAGFELYEAIRNQRFTYVHVCVCSLFLVHFISLK